MKQYLAQLGSLIIEMDQILLDRPYDVFHRGSRDYIINLLKGIRIASKYNINGDVSISTIKALVAIKLKDANMHLDIFPDSAYHKGARFGMNACMRQAQAIEADPRREIELPGRWRDRDLGV